MQQALDAAYTHVQEQMKGRLVGSILGAALFLSVAWGLFIYFDPAPTHQGLFSIDTIADVVVWILVTLLGTLFLIVVESRVTRNARYAQSVEALIVQNLQENIACDRVEYVNASVRGGNITATARVIDDRGVAMTYGYTYDAEYEVMVPETSAVQAREGSRLADYYDHCDEKSA